MSLENFTDHKRQKIKDAMKALGAPKSMPFINSQNRVVVRSWLNGLGFPTHTYENATLSELRDAYHSFTPTGMGLGLIPFVNRLHGGTESPSIIADVISEAINRTSVPLQDLEYEGVMQPDAQNVQNYQTPTTQPKQGEMTMTKSTAQKQEPQFWTDGTSSKGALPPKAGDIVTLTEAPAGVNPDAMKAVAALMAAIAQPQTAAIPEDKIIELIKKHTQATEVRIVKNGEERTIPTGLHHKSLPDVIKMLDAGINVMMVGSAGSGKTTIAEQAAKALNLPFYFNGALSSEYKLSGFVDAQGRIVSTAFRKAYESGGVYLFDEIDASMPDALLAFNAALANGHADFPDGTITRHADFRCMAAANTFGRGADRIYVGRNQLDGASLDRFAVINIDYDEQLERTLSANDNWVDFVLKIRRAVFDLKIRHVVSPRASIHGSKLLAAGMDRRFVEEATIWKGLDRDTVKKVTSQAGVL